MNIPPIINYRPGCGQTQDTIAFPSLGGCSQQSNTSSFFRILQNVTSMSNNSASVTYVPPYVFPGQTNPICGPWFDYVCPGPGAGGAECWPYPNTSIMKPSGGTPYSVNGWTNLYVTTPQTESYSNCRNIGWNGVLGYKNWQGRLSYTSPEWQKMVGWEWCCYGNNCGYAPYNSTPDTTRYRAISAASNYSHTVNTYVESLSSFCGGCIDCGDAGTYDDYCFSFAGPSTVTDSGYADVEHGVDVYGNNSTVIYNTGSTCPQCDPTAPPCTYCSDQAVNLLETSGADSDWRTLITTFCSYVGDFGLPDTVTWDDASGTGTVQWHVTRSCYDACGNNSSNTVELQDQLVLTAGTLTYTHYGVNPTPRNFCYSDGSCYEGWILLETTVWNYSATSFSYSSNIEGVSSMSFDITYTASVTAELQNPYTSTDVYNDVKDNLLSTWDMGNPSMMPPRQDTYLPLLPFVTRNEQANSPTIAVPISGVTSSIQFDGSVHGGPAPLGIIRSYDPSHANWCVCSYPDDVGDTCYEFYPQDYGAWSDDGVQGCPFVPRVTQWTNLYLCNNLPQGGAYSGNGFTWIMPTTCNEDINPEPTYGPELYCCKYAEYIIPTRQSYNFFRPCGLDRFQISGSSCINTASSSSITTLTDTTGILNSGDTLLVCNTGVCDGIWKAGSISGESITLNNLLLSGSQLPTSSILEGGPVVGRLRWESPLAPAITGETQIFGATNTNPVTCSFGEPIPFVVGDTFNVTGKSSWLNGTQTVTKVIDQQTVILSLNGTGKGTYLGGNYAKSLFTPDQMWNDTNPKGDFVSLNWTFKNAREYQEYYRLSASYVNLQGNTECDGVTTCPLPTLPPTPTNSVYWTCNCETTCLPITNPCSPMVAYFSPNSESFNPSNSVNLGFNFYGIDDQYASLNWQGAILQYMNDPLFMAPPQPCGNTNEWLLDNYSCENDSDTISFYQAPNVFEARCEPPTGAPALPNGCNLADCPITPPGSQNTYPLSGGCGLGVFVFNGFSTPWSILINSENCVCGKGRWWEEYSENGFQCQTPTNPPL